MLELKGNPNYAAFIYEVTQTHPLDGLDNLVGVNVGGYQALVPLSEDSPCDEGVVIRAEGITPHVAKFKNPRFYEHESVSMDKGEVDIEDAAS